jgi:predicted O-methyltransferase YrrM
VTAIVAALFAAAASVLLDLRRRHFKLGDPAALSLLDIAAPAIVAAMVAGGLFTALRQEPMVAAGTLAFVYLWRRGQRALQRPLADGIIAAELLILSGLAVGLRRLAGGAVTADDLLFPAAAAVAGVVALLTLRLRFRRRDAVRRVLEHVVRHGTETRPESHRATPECPYPDRWRMLDTMTAEVEVLEFLRTLMTTVKPVLVLETGTFLGISTLSMAEGLRANGFGKIVTCDPDPEVFARAQERIDASGLREWIDHRCTPSLEIDVPGTIDVLFCDSLPELREPEVRRFLPQVNPNGLILMHDASSHMRTVRDAALRLEKEGLISVVLLPTPRGLVIAQRRDRTA